MKLTKERLTREKKAFAATVKAAVQQDKDALNAIKRSDKLLTNEAKRAQALQAEITAAKNILGIQQKVELSTKERVRLIQIEKKFQQELQKARAGGLPIIPGSAQFAALRQFVTLLIDAKNAVKELADEEKAADKAFKAIIDAAAQQDKDRLKAGERAQAIIRSQEVAEAAFANRIRIAERSLAIEKDSSLTTKEKLRLVAQLTLFESELFKQRKAGVPLTSPEELANLREATDKIVEMKEKTKELTEKARDLDRVARDFSKVIGTAFEDAIIGGKGFREVLKGIIDDISKIVLRTQVTKPLETFLTKQLEDGGGGILDSLLGASDEAADSLKTLSASSVESSGVLSQQLVQSAIQAAVSTGIQSVAVSASTSAITLMAISAAAAAAALTALAASAAASGAIGILGGALGGVGGRAGTAGTSSPGGIGGFAHGGRFTVPGSGGTDSTLVRFRATPREEVTIRTPAQQQQEGIVVHIDARGADQVAIARLERIVLQMNATFNRRAVDAVGESRRRGGNIAKAFGG